MGKLSFLLLTLLAIGVGYWKHSQNIQQQEEVAEQARLERPRTDEEIRQAIRQSLNDADSVTNRQSATAEQNAPKAVSEFKCDGRQYCSQMTSCQEATFFLQNCPGVKMDGNNDGIPCEKQWCK